MTISSVQRNTKAGWDTGNPLIPYGIICMELPSEQVKVGDGIRHWLDLPYAISKTAAQWVIDDTLLATDEAGYETDTEKAKFGYEGYTWNNLAYINEERHLHWSFQVRDFDTASINNVSKPGNQMKMNHLMAFAAAHG